MALVRLQCCFHPKSAMNDIKVDSQSDATIWIYIQLVIAKPMSLFAPDNISTISLAELCFHATQRNIYTPPAITCEGQVLTMRER